MKKEDLGSWLLDLFSFSKMAAFSKCPRYAFNRYLLRLKTGPTEPLRYGRAVHDGQEHDNLEKVAGRRVHITEILDKAADSYKQEGGEDIDNFVREHARQLEISEETGVRDSVFPVKGTVEAPYQVVLNVTPDPEAEAPTPVLIEGYVDTISQRSEEDPAEVIDYKTGARPKSTKEAADDLQLHLNALGCEVPGGRFISFVKGGRQRPKASTTETTQLTQRKTNKLLTFIGDTVAGLRRAHKSGDWPKAHPSCWWCSPTACEFYDEFCYPDDMKDLGRFVSIEDVRPAGKCDVDTSWRKRK
jgi:RecB family exonuclease